MPNPGPWTTQSFTPLGDEWLDLEIGVLPHPDHVSITLHRAGHITQALCDAGPFELYEDLDWRD
jgi:hypothetical protein